jgi:uncharacterized protein
MRGVVLRGDRSSIANDAAGLLDRAERCASLNRLDNDAAPDYSRAMSEITFDDDAAAGRLRAMLDGEEAGHIEYDPIGTQSLLLKHTEVGSRYEGRGIGSRLVATFLDNARRRGRTVVPICPYALAFVRRHREYIDVVREDMRGGL